MFFFYKAVKHFEEIEDPAKPNPVAGGFCRATENFMFPKIWKVFVISWKTYLLKKLLLRKQT